MKAEASKTTEERGGRIETHGKGIGPPTPEAVENRAREIAETEVRSGDGVTSRDRVRASHELQGETPDLSSDERRSDIVASRNPANMAVETGHKVEDMQPVDEQEIMEAEIKEGVREGEHERMLEAQRGEQGGF